MFFFIGRHLTLHIPSMLSSLTFLYVCAFQYVSLLSTISSRHRQSVQLLFDTKCRCSSEVSGETMRYYIFSIIKYVGM